MGEFLAEASVLITPDATKFRATLIAELRKATEGVVVPIPVAAVSGAKGVVQANKAAAASAKEASVATEQLNASRTRQIITEREAVGQEELLANAQRLTAAAQQRVQAVETAGVRSTSALAAARAELRAANVAVVAGQRALDAALIEGAGAAQAEAVTVLRDAVALRANAIASEAAAAAKIVDTRATSTATRAHAQFTRGIEAETLHLGGVRGATLAASSGFLIGAAAITVGAKAVKEANANVEAAARTERVFGENAVKLERDARGLAGSFGIGATEALRFEGQIGNILSVSKLASGEIPGLSENLVKLAADMAAFNNVPLPTVLNAISLGLVGNSRGLRKFGIELSLSAVNLEALRISGKKNTDELTRADRVQARINLLFAQTINQQGAAASRSDSLAQKSRVLVAELQNLGDTIGRTVIPRLQAIVTDGTTVVSVFQKIGDAADTAAGKLDSLTGGGGAKGGFFSQAAAGLKSFAGSSLTSQFKFFGATIGTLIHGLPDVNRKIEIMLADGTKVSLNWKELAALQHKAWDDKQAARLGETIGNIASQTQHLITTLERVSFRNASNQLATLQDKLVGVKIAGGDATAELANLARQQAVAERRVAAAAALNATTGGRSPAALANLRQSREDLLAIIDEIKSIKEDQAAKAQQAAQDILDAAEAAAQKVRDAIQAADEETTAMIERLARPLDIPQLRAEATKSLVDDVAFQRTLQATIERQIAIAQSSIIDANLRAQTVHDLRVALVKSQIEEKALLQEQAQNRQQRNQAAFDRKAESVDLDIQLAQTQKNRQGEIAARQRRIALDQERLKAVRGDIIATKRLRNDIAEQRAAIKDLKKEIQKRNDALKEAEFLFLTTQTGFAGSLLSNLIPTSALAGTVGGSVTRPTGQTNLAGLGAANPAAATVAGGVSSAVQTHTAQKGASMGQMSTLIHVQRQMLTVMLRLVGQRAHPEATQQRSSVATAMDTTYGT